MKRMTIAYAAVAALAASAFTAGMVAADDSRMDHEMMHKMMHGDGAGMEMQADDARSELKLPAPMRVMQKKMMRRHMGTVGEIAGALGRGDLDRAAKLAKDELGWSRSEEDRCRTVSEKTGEKDFLDYGMAMHKKADELSAAAKAGERDRAVEKLSELINSCNSCHERFRL